MKSSKSLWIYIISHLTLSAAILLCVESSFAEEQLRKFVMCRNGKTVRTIRIEPNPKENGSWVTTYTKNGKDEVVGEGRNPASCDDVLERVQKTLETNSWKCKDMQDAVIHRETAGT